MKKATIISILAILIIIISAIGVFLVGWLLLPANSQDTQLKTFIIPRNQPILEIGQRLYDEGYIKHPYVFYSVVRSVGYQQRIQAGSFQISASLTPSQIAEVFTKGTSDVWITILEGWRAEEIAESLSRQDLPLFDAEEFLLLAKPNEGRLFPDTYLIPKQSSAQLIFNLLSQTFERKIIVDLASEIDVSDRSIEEIIILASLIEREARDFNQMRHVAGILENRLRIGMPLQVDATLQYVRGYESTLNDWWSPPRPVDKGLVSPYNTYLNSGLPPRPIANPGLNAIKAALDPMVVDDLFYLHARDGSMYYAKTLEEHNANIQRYLR